MTRNRRGAPTGSSLSRLGGHGLMSPVRMSSGTFLASWADVLHMVAEVARSGGSDLEDS